MHLITTSPRCNTYAHYSLSLTVTHKTRYTSPDEHAFFPNDLEEPILPLLSYSTVIQPNNINFNPKVKTPNKVKDPMILNEKKQIDLSRLS